MAGRHDEFLGVVEPLIVAHFDDAMLAPIRQRLDVLRETDRRAALAIDVILDALALDHEAVDVELAALHLDMVARQADDTLDVVGRVVTRQLEDGDIAAVGRREEDASR